MKTYRINISSNETPVTAATFDSSCSIVDFTHTDDSGFQEIVTDGHWIFDNNQIKFTASTNTTSSAREGYMTITYTVDGVLCVKRTHLVQEAPPTPKAVMTLSNGTNVTVYCNGDSTLTYRELADAATPSDVVAIDVKSCVESIDDYAFNANNFTNLTSITMANSSVRTIGNSVHSNSINYTKLKTITFSNYLTEIGESAFWGCNQITSLNFPNTLQTLKDSCFRECNGITAVTIPNSVRIIGFDAFHLCDGLQEVTIGTGWIGTTSIGRSFQGCSNLKKVTINATTPPDISDDFYFGGCHSDLKIYVPANSVNAYKNAAHWSSYSSRIRAIES